METTREDYQQAFKLLIGHEGTYSSVPADPGNWTGGRPHQGTLKGTKYGISAASYPNLDIRNLTLSDARDIYMRDFWVRSGCHDYSPRVSFIVFDSAVNNGVSRAVRWLQQTVGATQDGTYGPQTRGAVQRAIARNENHVIVEFHAHRLRFMSELQTWPTFRGGWSRRLVQVPLEAATNWRPYGERGEEV